MDMGGGASFSQLDDIMTFHHANALDLSSLAHVSFGWLLLFPRINAVVKNNLICVHFVPLVVPCQVKFLEVELRVGTKPVLSEDKIPLGNDDFSFIPSLR